MDIVNPINFIWDMTADEQMFIGVLLGAVLISALLRAVLISSFMAAESILNIQKKNILSKEDINKLPNIGFGRLARQYAEMAIYAPTDGYALAKQAVVAPRFLFFNYSSIGRLIKSIEIAVLPLGIAALLVLNESSGIVFVFIVFAIYLLGRVLAAIFDYEARERRYIGSLAYALNNHIGKFFPQDEVSAIATFSQDLQSLVANISSMYTEILNKITGEFAGSIKTGVGAMAKSVEATMSALLKQEGLNESITKWQIVVDEFAKSASDISNDVAELSGGLDVAKEGLAAYAHIVSSNARDINADREFIQSAINTFETSLKELMAALADNLGKVTSAHLASANFAISDNIAKILSSQNLNTAEMLVKIQSIFDEMLVSLRINAATNPKDSSQ